MGYFKRNSQIGMRSSLRTHQSFNKINTLLLGGVDDHIFIGANPGTVSNRKKRGPKSSFFVSVSGGNPRKRRVIPQQKRLQYCFLLGQ